jgi:hypothetical protein
LRQSDRGVSCGRSAPRSASVVCRQDGCALRRKSCREAINGLISLIDSNSDNTALYRDTFAVVVHTCGPSSPAPKPKDASPRPAGCHDLAAAMVDLIEDEKLNTAAFTKARDAFAQTCPPR